MHKNRIFVLFVAHLYWDWIHVAHEKNNSSFENLFKVIQRGYGIQPFSSFDTFVWRVFGNIKKHRKIG